MNVSTYEQIYILHTFMYNTHYMYTPMIPVLVRCYAVSKECNYLVHTCTYTYIRMYVSI